MPNRLADAISPYLRSHADNPVDWYPWGEEAFAEAKRRDVPVLVSIGYSTCHWCHVMARESFSDPELAQQLNGRFVAIKVDREEHPDVDAAYLAAASAFTRNLGWPLNVFTTPDARVFFAGTYFPPTAQRGQSSFAQVLDAVSDAWEQRRDDVVKTASMVAEALASAVAGGGSDLPHGDALDEAVTELDDHEDQLFGGFGAAPKFPVAPALGFLLGRSAGRELALRTLAKMAASPLRDPIDGGFFRYSTQRDWSEPHYERMLYDNAQLLRLYADAAVVSVSELVEGPDSAHVANGIARFLLETMQLASGGLASAQDSESTVDGERVEGVYYSMNALERAEQRAPARDGKVLTGWNGLAIGALAHAGFVLDRTDWITAARDTADVLLTRHRREDGTLIRASIGERVSTASATLEDYGMFAGGLLSLATATGEVRYAIVARELIEAAMRAAATASAASPFAVPGGADPVLSMHGLATSTDPSEGAYPSGLSAMASAAHTLFVLTGQRKYTDAAAAAMTLVTDAALATPLSFGAALRTMSALAVEPVQLVVVTADVPADDDELLHAARGAAVAVAAFVVTQEQASAFAAAGFELFEARTTIDGNPTAYLCRNFVCRLPTSDASALITLLDE